MALQLPLDFREFLTLLNKHRVEYLLIGGYAVGYHGYPRATNDLDVWVAIDPRNAERLVDCLTEFGFSRDRLSPELFLQEKNVVRMGRPPIRLEILTTISGVSFADCYQHRVDAIIDEVDVHLISLSDLKLNKKASGRHKDLADLENLP